MGGKEIDLFTSSGVQVAVEGYQPHVASENFHKFQKRYFDGDTGLFLAVGKSVYCKKMREFVVVYKEEGDDILLITFIH